MCEADVMYFCRCHESEELDCEMPSLPDTLRILIVRFATLTWSVDLESMILGLLNLDDHQGSYNLSAKFLEPSHYSIVIN